MSKKTLAVTAFALLLSQQSFASETEGFYFGGGYHGQFFNSMSELKVESGDKITRTSVNDVGHFGTKGQFLNKYEPNYDPLFAGGIALGYEGELGDNSYRAELEGMYSSVKVDNVGLEGNRISLSYLRTVENSPVAASGSQQASGGTSAPGSQQASGSTSAPGSQQASGSNNSGKTYGYGTVVDNDQIENASVMANAYYYWKNDGFSFSPYVGAGIGATRMKMFGTSSIRPAYQVKAGLDYSINENVNMHVGYRHFGVIGGNFDLKAKAKGEKVSTNTKLNTDSKPSKEDDTINVSSGLFATHGMEAGLTFHFASKA